MGHVVLRNDAPGVDQQLVDGVNGLRVDNRDVEQFIRVIERLLNLAKTTNADLQAMGRSSQIMAGASFDRSYTNVFAELDSR